MSAPSPRGTSSAPPAPPPPRSAALDIALRVVGGIVAVWGGVLLGLYATFMTPFRIGATLVPISLVLAVGGNAALVWFGWVTTRSKVAALLPGLAWAALAFVAANKTTEGDLVLIQKNWVATVYLFAGTITVAVAAYRLIVPKPLPIVPRD